MPPCEIELPNSLPLVLENQSIPYYETNYREAAKRLLHEIKDGLGININESRLQEGDEEGYSLYLERLKEIKKESANTGIL